MSKILNYKLLFLSIIILLAAFLRFYKLGTNPPSLTWDEAAWGYNAYSLGIDGKDEFGRFLPVDYLESFGDYKPPVYAYLDIIPVKIFGLNEFSTRFPSALFGVLTVLLTYYLVINIFIGSKFKVQYGITASLIMALSPWHIMLSRAAFEANIATFFIVMGVFLFLKIISRGVASLSPPRWNSIYTSGFLLTLSLVSFILSMYTFNSARIVSPLIVLILAVCFRRELFARKKQVIFAVILGTFLLLPFIKFLLTPAASLRFREVNIFSDLGIIKNANQEIVNDNNAFWSKIIHNRRFAYGVLYLRHYFDNLDPSFLFIKGDGNPKFATQTVGQMFLWDLPFFIAGIFLLFKRKEGYWWIIPVWLVLGIIPAASARETPHALRIEATLPTFQIITAVGFVLFLYWLINLDLKKYFKFLIIIFIFSSLFFNFIYFYHDYFAHYPRIYSREWQYGYKDSINYVKNVKDDYDEIRVTDKLGRAYIYYLFYTKTSPSEFRRTAEIHRNAFGFVKISKFSKFRFSDSIRELRSKTRKILYIDDPTRVPSKYTQILKRFYLLDGEEVLTAYRHSI